MKPFSLTAVLRYRRQLEDTAAVKLTRARQRFELKNDELLTAKKHYESLLAQLEKEQAEGISIDNLQRYQNHLGWCKNKVAELETQVETEAENVRKKRAIAIDRNRDRQALEKLKEKQNRAWKAYLEKKEAALLDEMAVVAHERKTNGN